MISDCAELECTNAFIKKELLKLQVVFARKLQGIQSLVCGNEMRESGNDTIFNYLQLTSASYRREKSRCGSRELLDDSRGLPPPKNTSYSDHERSATMNLNKLPWSPAPCAAKSSSKATSTPTLTRIVQTMSRQKMLLVNQVDHLKRILQSRASFRHLLRSVLHPGTFKERHPSQPLSQLHALRHRNGH
jgi:hypothetical protein